MESENSIDDTEKGSLMSDNKGLQDKTVTFRSKGNKNLADEPEMQGLERMIQNNEIDQDRLSDYLEQESGKHGDLEKEDDRK